MLRVTYTGLANTQFLMTRGTGRLVEVLQFAFFLRLERFERVDGRELFHGFFDFTSFSQRFDFFRSTLDGKFDFSNLFHLQSDIAERLEV